MTYVYATLALFVVVGLGLLAWLCINAPLLLDDELSDDELHRVGTNSHSETP